MRDRRSLRQGALMAQQLFKRFPIKQYFSDLTKLLSEARPDVVHITTPPQSHFDIAKTCLEWGCHVYVEKPFTVWEDEARRLIGLRYGKRLEDHSRARRSIQPCGPANASSDSRRLPGRHPGAHGELLLLRDRADPDTRERFWEISSIGFGGCRECCCRISSAMELPGSQST